MPKSYKTKWVNGKQVRLHRHLMEQHLKRKLSTNELVHHVNGVIHDNRIENLEVIARGSHMKLHEIGIASRYKKRHFLPEVEICEEYEEGISINELKNKSKCSAYPIRMILQKYDIDTLSRKHNRKEKGDCKICGEKEYNNLLCRKHYMKNYHYKRKHGQNIEGY